MAPSPIQRRAEAAAQQFAVSARRSVVIEFAGLPKAGKTTTISQVHTFLKRCGFRVETVVERASVCPIRDKKHANFNVWTACTTLAQLLEKTQDPPRLDDPQILFLDRGIFDAICWLTFMEKLARIRKDERECIERFLSMTEWRHRLTAVILMTTDPEVSMKRERGALPVESTGSIMNPEVLEQMRGTLDEVEARHSGSFRIIRVDTSLGDTAQGIRETAEMVATSILDLIDEEIAERILCLSKASVTSLFDRRSSVDPSRAEDLIRAFEENGEYVPRARAEASLDLVQALPVVIVRNKSGHILRLRRRERSDEDPLHEKIVIWAGGHVRQEDATPGPAIVTGALRELDEELRICVEKEQLRLLGAVYADNGRKTSHHVAVVFEWRAETDDIAVALSNAEFFERRGTSLSGKFVDPESLAQETRDGKIDEVWSAEIVQDLLPETDVRFQPRLF